MQALIAANDSIVQLLARSNEYEEKGELRTAIAYAQQAFAEIQTVDAVSFLPLVQARLARLLIRTGDYAEGVANARRVLEHRPESAVTADAWISLGVSSAETGDLDEAEAFFLRAIDLSRGLEEYVLLARALHNLALNVHLVRGQFDLALATMREAQHHHSSQENHQWGLPFLQAIVAELTGKNRLARQALDELLPLLRPTDRLTGGYFYLWARLAIGEGEFNRAEEYLHLLMRIATTTGASDLNIWARVEQGRYHRLKGEPATGRTWADDGLKFAQRIGYAHMAGQASLEIAQCARLAQDPSAAQKYLESAIQTFQRCGATYDLAVARFFDAAWAYEDKNADAEEKWLAAAAAILTGEFGFLLEKERETAFALIAAYLRSGAIPARKAAESLLRRLERVAPPPLRVFGLGSFQVWQGRKLIADNGWQRRRAGELFRFLLLQTGFSAGRDLILETFWPDNDPQAAVGLLHQATSTLRHILEPDLPDKFPSRYLSVEGERVTLVMPDSSQVDFLEFEQQITKAIAAKRIDLLQTALHIVRGDLFPTDRYADWSTSRRERITDLYYRGMQALGQQHLAQGAYFEALECSRAIVHEDSWNEDAVLLGMQAYLGLHDAPHALRMYQSLEKTLDDELGLIPRSDLGDLALSLRHQPLRSE